MATHKASHGERDTRRVEKTVGVYEKPAKGAGIPRPALYAGAVALALGLGAAALYWL